MGLKGAKRVLEGFQGGCGVWGPTGSTGSGVWLGMLGFQKQRKLDSRGMSQDNASNASPIYSPPSGSSI